MFGKKQMKKQKYNKGSMMIQVIAFTAIGIFVLSTIISSSVSSLKMGKRTQNREQALQIAEAGIEYYRWHLAHDATDYYDGNGSTSTGPYVHDFLDKDGNRIGSYELKITPPPLGSTMVAVESTGKFATDTVAVRKIKARFAKPSYAKYGLVSNAPITLYGTGDDVYGEIYSNGVVRFNSGSKTHSLVTSMVNWKDVSGYGRYWGVSCSGDPTPTTMYTNKSCPTILIAGRKINAPQISFNNLSLDLAQLRTKSIDNGSYLGSSGAMGYLIRFKPDNTYDLYRVDTLRSKASWCTNETGESDWGVWSVNSSTFITNKEIPSDGVVYVADDLWVEGTLDNSRITVASGRVAAGITGKPDSNIIINEDLVYSKKDGSSVFGAVAENNVLIGLYSADDLEIDGALIAQKGAVKRPYYSSYCSATYYRRNTLRTFGMYVTNKQPYFSFSSGGVVTSGFQSQPAQYDGDLLYAPPPAFPLTTDQYQIISWSEI